MVAVSVVFSSRIVNVFEKVKYNAIMAAVKVIQKIAEVALLSNMVKVPSAYLNQIE